MMYRQTTRGSRANITNVYMLFRKQWCDYIEIEVAFARTVIYGNIDL